MQTPKKILLVDDDSTAFFLTLRALRQATIEVKVLIASHGREAFKIVRKSCEQEQCPEFIFLDIHMPVMDEFEFLEAIEKLADLRKADLKIVLVSSSSHHLDFARAKQYMVMNFKEKPLTAEKLSEFL